MEHQDFIQEQEYTASHSDQHEWETTAVAHALIQGVDRCGFQEVNSKLCAHGYALIRIQ